MSGLPGYAGTKKIKAGRKTQWGFTAARDSEWQWHQLGHMQICTSTKTDNHHSVFTGRVPFLQPNRQRQSTEGTLSL